jgi:hypothetical protein
MDIRLGELAHSATPPHRLFSAMRTYACLRARLMPLKHFQLISPPTPKSVA